MRVPRPRQASAFDRGEMLSHRVDLGDGRAGVRQRAIRRNRSSSEVSSSIGFSTIDDPPPLSRKITSAEAGCDSSARKIALAA